MNLFWNNEKLIPLKWPIWGTLFHFNRSPVPSHQPRSSSHLHVQYTQCTFFNNDNNNPLRTRYSGQEKSFPSFLIHETVHRQYRHECQSKMSSNLDIRERIQSFSICFYCCKEISSISRLVQTIRKATNMTYAYIHNAEYSIDSMFLQCVLAQIDLTCYPDQTPSFGDVSFKTPYKQMNPPPVPSCRIWLTFPYSIN